jgi:hypothetical protein
MQSQKIKPIQIWYSLKICSLLHLRERNQKRDEEYSNNDP